MKKKVSKKEKVVTLSTLDKRVAHLEKTMMYLSSTVDNLAEATAKGFANTATKKDFENLKIDFQNLGNNINNTLENHIKIVHSDYDELSARVKRLEITVFKR